MFASATLGAHVVRGALGFGAVAVGLAVAPAHPWLAWLALPVALLAFRGCPACWTIGLVETVLAGVQGRRAPDACIDGSCAVGSVRTKAPGQRAVSGIAPVIDAAHPGVPR